MLKGTSNFTHEKLKRRKHATEIAASVTVNSHVSENFASNFARN